MPRYNSRTRMLRGPRASSGAAVSLLPPWRVLLPAILIASSGVAASTTVDLASAHPVDLEGTVAAILTGGVFTFYSPKYSGSYAVTLANASAVYWEYEQQGTNTAGGVYPVGEDARPTRFDVSPSPIQVVFSEEEALVNVAANGSALMEIVPHRTLPGFPHRLESPLGLSSAQPLPTPIRRPTNGPAFSCPTDWWFQGRYEDTRGWPASGPSDIRMSGRIQVGVFRGTATLVDATGAVRTFELGRHVVDPGVAGTGVGRREHSAVMFIDGDGIFTMGAADGWAACAPQQAVRVDGAAMWQHARGEATDAGTTERFSDASVELRGRFNVTHGGSGATPVSPVAYAGAGHATVFIDGEPVAAAAVTPSAPVSEALTLAAAIVLLLALAGKGMLAFYTRLGPDQMLAHPRRRAIFEAVSTTPGIHKRELQRRIGSAWGSFAFHLEMLEKSGYLHVTTDHGYAQVFARDSRGPSAPAIAHPVPRAIYDALPADGSRIALAALRRQTGLTPQLLNYHMRVLDARGLITVEGRNFGPKTVARRHG